MEGGKAEQHLCLPIEVLKRTKRTGNEGLTSSHRCIWVLKVGPQAHPACKSRGRPPCAILGEVPPVSLQGYPA